MSHPLIDYSPIVARGNGTSSQQGSFAAASAGITGGYEGNSTSLKIIIAFLLGLSLYNAVETTLLIFATFQRFAGIYFWSLLISTLGVLPYSTGFILKFYSITPATDDSHWLSVTMITIGWYTMVTGQAVVLWSRLHLILIGRNADKILKYTKWMIISNVFILHMPTSVLLYGCNGTMAVRGFIRVFNVYEKIQMVGFCLQELLLSSIYIYYTVLMLRNQSHIQNATASAPTISARKILYQLFIINVIIIALDVVLLGFEFANLYILEASFKGVVYSLKTKLEFAVLGKLVQLVRRERTLSTANTAGRQFSIAFDPSKKGEGGVNGNGNIIGEKTYGNDKVNGYSNGNPRPTTKAFTGKDAFNMTDLATATHKEDRSASSDSSHSNTINHSDEKPHATSNAKGFSSDIHSHWTNDDDDIHPQTPQHSHHDSTRRLRQDSIEGLRQDSVEETLEHMKQARRTVTPKSVKGSEDAMYEHYEMVLDRHGAV